MVVVASNRPGLPKLLLEEWPEIFPAAGVRFESGLDGFHYRFHERISRIADDDLDSVDTRDVDGLVLHVPAGHGMLVSNRRDVDLPQQERSDQPRIDAGFQAVESLLLNHVSQ